MVKHFALKLLLPYLSSLSLVTLVPKQRPGYLFLPLQNTLFGTETQFFVCVCLLPSYNELLKNLTNGDSSILLGKKKYINKMPVR